MYPLRNRGSKIKNPTALLSEPRIWTGGGNVLRKARNENLTVPSRGVSYVQT